MAEHKAETDAIDVRIEELMELGYDWHSAYLFAKCEDHRERAALPVRWLS